MLSNPATNSLQGIEFSVRGIKAVAVQGLDKRWHSQRVDGRGGMGLEHPKLLVNLLERHRIRFRKKFTEFLLVPFAPDSLFYRFNFTVNVGENSNQKPSSSRNNGHLLKQPDEYSRATQNVDDGKSSIYSAIKPSVHVIKLDTVFDIEYGFKVRSIVLSWLCHNLPLLGRVLRRWRRPCWAPCGRHLASSFLWSSHGLPRVRKMLRDWSQHFDTCRYDHLIVGGGV